MATKDPEGALPRDHDPRLRRARLSLEGLALGDAFGERFFVPDDEARRLVEDRVLPPPIWRYTDDTMMALGIVEVLDRHGRIDPDRLAEVFAKRFVADPGRGYGGMAQRLLSAFAAGEPWREASAAVFDGQGSYGNGAAMRAAPIGAYFADDLDRVVDEAATSAEVTHAHPEAVIGAAAVALGAALAAGPAVGRERPWGGDFLDAVLEHLPDSLVRLEIEEARSMPEAASPPVAALVLGSGNLLSAQDTVPFVLWSASRRTARLDEALWQTVAGLGDRDTTCAMVGGIFGAGIDPSAGEDAADAGVPPEWLRRREALPDGLAVFMP